MTHSFHLDGTKPDASDPDLVFVFGSNSEGVHGAGAAKAARLHFGAVSGVSQGPTGRAYAVPTRIYHRSSKTFRNIPVTTIAAAVERLLAFASRRPHLTFFCTRIGCGLAGNADATIAALFANAPGNFSFAEEWRATLEECASPTTPMTALAPSPTPMHP